jgi:hypothetical protein
MQPPAGFPVNPQHKRVTTSMPIPTVIHQIWIQGQEDLPEIYRRASKTWQKKNPDWNYRLWDDRALRELMATAAPEWLPLYEVQGGMIGKADVGRYALLLVLGGLYADMDTECVRPVATMLQPSPASLFLQVYDNPWSPVGLRSLQYRDITNSVIASVPAHPIWRQVRAQIERNSGASWGVFQPVAKSYAEHHPEDVCLRDHRWILTAFRFPRVSMRGYGFIRRKICVLDFNDSGRAAVVRLLRRPDHLIVEVAKEGKRRLSRLLKRSGLL